MFLSDLDRSELALDAVLEDPSELALDAVSEDPIIPFQSGDCKPYSRLAQQKEDKRMDQEVIPIYIQLDRDVDRAERNLRQANDRVRKISQRLVAYNRSRWKTDPNKAYTIEYLKTQQVEAVSDVTFETIALETSTQTRRKWNNIHLHEPHFGRYPPNHALFVRAKAKRPLPPVQHRRGVHQQRIDLFDRQMEREREENVRRVAMEGKRVREPVPNVIQSAATHSSRTHTAGEYYCQQCHRSYSGKWELQRHENTGKHGKRYVLPRNTQR